MIVHAIMEFPISIYHILKQSQDIIGNIIINIKL